MSLTLSLKPIGALNLRILRAPRIGQQLSVPPNKVVETFLTSGAIPAGWKWYPHPFTNNRRLVSDYFTEVFPNAVFQRTREAKAGTTN